MFNKIHETKNDAMDQARNVKNEAQKSSRDWVNYIMEHPVQSLMFGAVIGLALRGLFKQ